MFSAKKLSDLRGRGAILSFWVWVKAAVPEWRILCISALQERQCDEFHTLASWLPWLDCFLALEKYLNAKPLTQYSTRIGVHYALIFSLANFFGCHECRDWVKLGGLNAFLGSL